MSSIETRGHDTTPVRCGNRCWGWSRRPCIDPVEIVRRCTNMTSSSVVRSEALLDLREGNESSHWKQDRMKLAITRDACFNFEWCEEKYEVLNFFDAMLPSQIDSPVDELSMRSSSPDSRGRKRVRRLSLARMLSSSPDIPPLPRHYYSPWPPLTHMLPFPGASTYRVAERSVAALNDYRVQMQSDDSVELGLRILAHKHIEKTPLTVHPVTRVWGILKGRETEDFNATSAGDVAYIHDLQRRLCPYMPVTIGLSRAFVTMMVYSSHWWVVLFVGVDVLMGVIIEKLRSVSDELGDGYPESSELMAAYAKSFDSVDSKGFAICVVDSLRDPLPRQGWVNIKKYLFICIYHALTCRLTVADEVGVMGRVKTCDTTSQVLHLACASYQMIEKILWDRRVHIAGPQQPDEISCGAYGLATVWKLASETGLREMEGVIHSTLSTSGGGCEVVIPKSKFHNFYDSDFVGFIIHEIDQFVRREVISSGRSLPDVTKIE